jgi:hypothetical protein
VITVYAFLQDSSFLRTDVFDAEAAVEAHRALAAMLGQDAETAIFITTPYRMSREEVEKIQELVRLPVNTKH